MKALLFIILTGLGTFTHEGPLQITQEKAAKSKVKDEKIVVRDKSKPVRRELEKQYAKLSEAVSNKDLAAFLALRTSDFSTRDFNGQPHTTEQMTVRTRLLLERIQPPIKSKFEIETIDLRGDAAVATVRQEFSRMQLVAGQLRKVETSVTQDETWVMTNEGWKLKFVDNERDLLRFIDGKRVEPGKPYDPSAPPYDPKERKPE
jgi:hypothetical protein